jgi:RNA-directed DNA polymerase
MMHGHEKSESAIVAVKPTNKALHSAAEQTTAEPFAAEPVEPRAETKRNAGQQSTCGTQGQISVSQALGRSRMRKSWTSGSARGARGNSRPYRNPP